jgi:hypothetical protein
MSEITPGEDKGLPVQREKPAKDEEKPQGHSHRDDARGAQIKDDVTKLDPVAEEAEPLVKTDQTRKESAA